jgi:hypothetical protein
MASVDPQLAVQWAEVIADPVVRGSEMEGAIKAWFGVDPFQSECVAGSSGYQTKSKPGFYRHKVKSNHYITLLRFRWLICGKIALNRRDQRSFRRIVLLLIFLNDLTTLGKSLEQFK